MISFGAQQRIAASLDRIARAETKIPGPRGTGLKPKCLECGERGPIRVHRDASGKVTIWCSSCGVEPVEAKR